MWNLMYITYMETWDDGSEVKYRCTILYIYMEYILCAWYTCVRNLSNQYIFHICARLNLYDLPTFIYVPTFMCKNYVPLAVTADNSLWLLIWDLAYWVGLWRKFSSNICGKLQYNYPKIVSHFTGSRIKTCFLSSSRKGYANVSTYLDIWLLQFNTEVILGVILIPNKNFSSRTKMPKIWWWY